MNRSPSKFRSKIGLGRQTMAIAAGVVVGLLAVVPLPYFIIAPGHALDLATRVTVEGRAVSPARYYLTDVTVGRATAFGMLARFLPATDVVPSDDVVPKGQTAEAFDRSMSDAMTESQNVAAYVAERAAGLPVRASFVVRVEGFPPGSPAATVLRRNDRLLSVSGAAVRGNDDIARAIARVPGNAAVAVVVAREGKKLALFVPPMRTPRGRRLGVYASARLPSRDLPLPVRFAMDDVSGASAGLMFALQIYADIHGFPGMKPIAGTGTIAADGTVGSIEGARQKIEAARRVGASVFFVPQSNYAGVAHIRNGIEIVPVKTFADAVGFLEKR